MPDEDFKRDINHIRKDAEQKLVGALTRFHYRKIECTKNKLIKTKSEDSIQKLKAHTEKKTCPKSLRYKVRANIVPDEDFKRDINHIRKDAEQKLVGALTRFHYRKIERTKNKLIKTDLKILSRS